MKTVETIIILVVFALAFIAWFYFTIRITPESKRKERSKSSRILGITAGIVLLALAWIAAPHGSVAAKILLSLFAIQGIYRGLKGWHIKTERV